MYCAEIDRVNKNYRAANKTDIFLPGEGQEEVIDPNQREIQAELDQAELLRRNYRLEHMSFNKIRHLALK